MSERPCNTVIVSESRPHMNFSYLDVGQSFILPDASNPNNPCVYYKINFKSACYQHGNGQIKHFNPGRQVIPVTVIETHITIN